MSDIKPPQFFKVSKSETAFTSPEQVFYSLRGRASSHGYLRGPQQDVLRDFSSTHARTRDLALELPTGTGKTTVGLLIAEWKRLGGQKSAFLCLTNQLAGQVLEEAKRLGVSCADLRGTKETRDVQEEGRYRSGAAVAVTTYSNLFNINPVIRDADLLIFDDAHGGEQYVAGMWTLSVQRSNDSDLFHQLLNALSPAFTKTQLEGIFDATPPVPLVDLADVRQHPECLGQVAAIMRTQVDHPSRFAWRFISQNLHACFFLVSAHEISIRPFIPPTHTHVHFENASQRIYMSATLGGGSDLLRSYGLTKIEVLRSASEQWGKRYIFVPGLHCDEEQSLELVAGLWNEIVPKRAVLLAPSEPQATRAFDGLVRFAIPPPTRLSAKDISDSLIPFTTSIGTLLTLAGRYDGLDLPDDQCRLLIMYGSPVAINLLERHLADRWKLGPIFRRRERTRLIQGMGRCTRNATDFAVSVWLGQSLIDAATSRSLVDGFPSVLAAELAWGIEQSAWAGTSPREMLAMMSALASDATYRAGADGAIAAIQATQKTVIAPDYEDSGADEVRFSKALWDSNFEYALQIARAVADKIVAPELAGYRAWWWYLTSIAAACLQNSVLEADALSRASSTGINTGWLSKLLRERKAVMPMPNEIDTGAEGLWNWISRWGWAGPEFSKIMQQMVTFLESDKHKDFHQGLEILGRCFGTHSERPTTDGAPDAIWMTDIKGIAFEAKTEKKNEGSLFKRDLQEAKGHPEWIRFYREKQGNGRLQIDVVIVSSSNAIHKAGEAFTQELFHVSPDVVLAMAKQASESVRELRTLFSGEDFASAAIRFTHAMQARKLDWKSVEAVLLSTPLPRTK